MVLPAIVGILAIVAISVWLVRRFEWSQWLTWDSAIEAIVGLLQSLFR